MTKMVTADYAKALKDEVATQDALLHRAAEMLRLAQFGTESQCPICKGMGRRHAPDCALAALIRELESRLAL